MTTKSPCEQFLDDPERYAGHVETCERCRGAVAELERLDGVLRDDAAVARSELDDDFLESLPVAPWEGAAHRAWSLVVAVAAILSLGAVALFFLGGISPLEGFRAVFSSSTGSVVGSLEAAGALPSLLARVPAKYHVLLGIAFVVVNFVFIALLRRAPRGYDASSR